MRPRKATKGLSTGEGLRYAPRDVPLAAAIAPRDTPTGPLYAGGTAPSATGRVYAWVGGGGDLKSGIDRAGAAAAAGAPLLAEPPSLGLLPYLFRQR